MVSEYKYLGVVLDDRLNLEPNKAYKQTKYNELKRKEWILRKSSLNGNAKLQIWKSLFLSKWNYAMDLLSTHSEKAYKHTAQLMAKAYKTLAGIKQPISYATILDTAVGLPYRCYTSENINRKMEKMDVVAPVLCEQLDKHGVPRCSDHTYTPVGHVPPIETLAKLNAMPIFKIKCNAWLQGWSKRKPTAADRSKWQKQLCTCGDQLTMEHFFTCHHQTNNLHAMEQDALSLQRKNSYSRDKDNPVKEAYKWAKSFEPTPIPNVMQPTDPETNLLLKHQKIATSQVTKVLARAA